MIQDRGTQIRSDYVAFLEAHGQLVLNAIRMLCDGQVPEISWIPT